MSQHIESMPSRSEVSALNSKIDTKTANIVNVGYFYSSDSSMMTKISESIDKVNTNGQTANFTANPSQGGVAFVSGFLYADKTYGGGYYVDTYREGYWYLNGGNIQIINEQKHITGSSTYLTSYEFYYVHIGNICIFSGSFVPNTNISTSTGGVDNCGLPKPLMLSTFTVNKNDLSFEATDSQNRFIGIANAGGSTTSARFKAVGAYTSGITYVFSGSYITLNKN